MCVFRGFVKSSKKIILPAIHIESVPLPDTATERFPAGALLVTIGALLAAMSPTHSK